MGAPTIATAALATAVGFLVLLLSPVPMVRGFGVLLVVGIAIALVCALTAGSAALALRPGDGGVLERLGAAAPATSFGCGRLWKLPSGAARDAAEIVRDRAHGSRGLAVRGSRRRRACTRLVDVLTGRRAPAIVLGLALMFAIAGWALDTQTSVQSDITKLVPTTMPALRDLRLLEHVTGVSGEIDVTVRAADVTKAPVVSWMASYEQSLLQHYGYLETKGCAHATLCPALSLPDLFSGGVSSTSRLSSALNQSSINSLLGAVPKYFSQAVITQDHREATLAFGIRLMPLSQAAAGDRLHDLAAAPARGGHRAARRPAGAGGAGERARCHRRAAGC